jgi:hypothetical protein
LIKRLRSAPRFLLWLCRRRSPADSLSPVSSLLLELVALTFGILINAARREARRCAGVATGVSATDDSPLRRYDSRRFSRSRDHLSVGAPRQIIVDSAAERI